MCRAAKVVLLQVEMPYWASDWWDGYYWDYNTWKWEWGGQINDHAPPNHVPANQLPSEPAAAVPGASGSSHANGVGQGDNADESGWMMPSILEEADATYRIRSLRPTPMEHDLLVQAFQGNNGATKYLSRILKHWGKNEVYNDCKALLSMLQTEAPSQVGDAVAPGSAQFAIAKCMLAGHRAAQGEPDDACHCSPMMYVAGCKHNKPALIAPRKGLQDSMCYHCSRCIRCNGLPSCITNTTNSTDRPPAPKV